MTPHEFVENWKRADLSERSACQQHFLDLCDLLGQPKPAAADPDGAWYTFERGVRKIDGGSGWADVWMRGHFGWEYKGKLRDVSRLDWSGLEPSIFGTLFERTLDPEKRSQIGARYTSREDILTLLEPSTPGSIKRPLAAAGARGRRMCQTPEEADVDQPLQRAAHAA